MKWFETEDGGRERFEDELDALRRAGYLPEVNRSHPDGRLHINVTVPIDGTPTAMEVVYPSHYPYFRFELVGPLSLGLPHHQHPIDGTLCLLDQTTWFWSPSLRAADVISTQVPQLIRANQVVGAFDGEIQAPEPLTHYIDYLPNSMVIIPPEGFTLPSERASGAFLLALGSSPAGFRGFIEQFDGVGTTLPDLSAAFPVSQHVAGRWMRIERPRSVRGPDLEMELIQKSLLRPPHLTAKHPIELTAFLFDDEMAYPRVMGPNWILMVRRRVHPRWSVNLIRTERFDQPTQAARLRSLESLVERTVLQVGVGGLGAPAAHLLAQCRIGELRMVDFDVALLGNAVRWTLGFSAAGYVKADALARFIRANYPESRVVPLRWMIGHLASDDAGNWVDEQVMYERALEGADAVLDGSAELGVQQFLSSAARLAGLPYVLMEATPGAFGGIVAHFAASGPCWMCLQYAIRDGVIRPPLDASGTLQLAGCAAPTFTGAPFDLVPISALAVRTLALILTDRPPAWNVAVLANRDTDTGELGDTPRWTHHSIGVHPDCRGHADA